MTTTWDSAEQALKRLELAWVEPLIIAARKRRRLDLFGVQHQDDLGCAEIDLMPHGGQCVAACTDFVAADRRYFSTYLFGGAHRHAAPYRGIPCVIDLDRYQNFDLYLDRARRHSKGANLRQVRQARAQGFFCRMILRDLYLGQRFDIDTSKRFRSGLVLAALLRKRPASEFADGITPADLAAYLGLPVSQIVHGMPLPEPPLPACLHHWVTDWGVFIREDAGDRGVPNDSGTTAVREHLVGYLFLRRTGNVVRIASIMGHGNYLPRHVMKLLFHDAAKWLLTRGDPRVQGLRYSLYGAIEHGNKGLLEWKRRFEFAPMRFSYVDSGSLAGETALG